MTEEVYEGYVPIEELAAHLSLSVHGIRRWVNIGHIPADTYIRVGRTYRFCIPQVVEALKANPQQEEAPEQLELDLENNTDDGVSDDE